MGPITPSSLIQRSFAIFRVGFVPFCTLALIFYLPVALLQRTVFGSGSSGFTAEDTDLAATMLSSSGLLLMLAYVLLIPIASAAVVYGVFQGLRGQEATLGQCLAVAAARWQAIIQLAILTLVLVGIGYLMCIVPGAVLTYGFFVAGPALIVEKLEPIEAMKRSWQLTFGHKLVLFVLTLAITSLQLTASILLNLAFGTDTSGIEATNSFDLAQVFEILIVVVFTAFNAVAAGVAYHDLRSFRESLGDNELAGAFD